MSDRINLRSLPARLSAFGIVASLFPVCALGANTWDLKSDWSDIQNPNGVWSYNSDSTPLPHISGSTMPGGNLINQPGWAACQSCRGFWFKSSISIPLTDWSIGDVVVHTQDQYSNPYDHAANVTWVSPIAGAIAISGNVWMDDGFADRASQWNLYIKGVLVSSGQLSGTDPYDRANPFSLSSGTGGPGALTGITVNPGDKLKLEVVRTSSYGYFVGTNLAVSAVPEMNIASLFLLGAGAIIATARRRARAPHR